MLCVIIIVIHWFIADHLHRRHSQMAVADVYLLCHINLCLICILSIGL